MKTKLITVAIMVLLTSGCKINSTMVDAPEQSIDDTASACTITNPRTAPVEFSDKSYLAIGPDDFREQVKCILEDDRSWAGIRPVADMTAPDFIIFLAGERQANDFCGAPFDEARNRTISCNLGNMIAMNNNRWISDTNLRIAVLNHEVGHQLGHQHGYAGPCSIMTNGDGCPQDTYWPPDVDNKLHRRI